MEKDWVHLPRSKPEYRVALANFLKSANENLGNPLLLKCPCIDCKNLVSKPQEKVYSDLLLRGMDPTYIDWVFHGEYVSTSRKVLEDPITSIDYEMLFDTHVLEDLNDLIDEPVNGSSDKDPWEKIVEEADVPLYLGCKTHTKLTAIISLFKHKTVGGLSQAAFDELLKTIHEMLPKDNCLPLTTYKCRKFLRTFELGCVKIHACENDCCLFRNNYADRDTCPKCGASRWKTDNSNIEDDDINGSPERRVPVKVLRYFPIIPRIKRLFGSVESAKQVIWHKNNQSRDGKMRHPVDSVAWKKIDQKWPDFAEEPRNLRFGLAADGFNPFGDLSAAHSCWPVMLAVYNLPPWLCMQRENIMLSLLIPGPRQPGNDIDVFLQPLIDDLKEIWDNGVDVYDSASCSVFKLHAILMWTINDFPAYGNLAGCTYKGKTACPICGVHTLSKWLPFSSKLVYLNYRRFLPRGHTMRNQKGWFDGTQEKNEKPHIMSGVEVLEAQSSIVNDFGKPKQDKDKNKKKNSQKTKKKTCTKRKRTVGRNGSDNLTDGQKLLKMWKKKSIFFELPYWKDLLLRHNIDVMHTEKNVCESILGTLLHIKHKTKDGINSRKDLVVLGQRPELHPIDKDGKQRLPQAPYRLPNKDKEIFIDRLRNLKVPDGYSSNIRRCFSKDNGVYNLKAHDYHVLMQQLLCVALRGLLPEGPRNAIFRLCAYFNELCQRAVDRNRLVQLEEEVVVTLCMFEKYWPPSFFDVMIHLCIHLAREVRLCGPVQYRWMYPFERYMKIFKQYVKNKAHPAGCIAECYSVEEGIRFVKEHVPQAAGIGERHKRNEGDQDDSKHLGRPVSKGSRIQMETYKLKIAHRYVLFNTPEVRPYEEMHMEELKILDRRLCRNLAQLEKTHSATFVEWFQEKVKSQICTGTTVLDKVRWLSYGPLGDCMSYTGYIINGVRFHIASVQRATQCSGVCIESNITSVSVSGCVEPETNVHSASNTFYGVLRQIIVLDYRKFQIPVFSCDWAHMDRGVKVEDGFTLANFNQHQNQFESDPFILASQAKQVFYSREKDASNWCVVLKPPPRGFHELELYDENGDTNYQPLDTTALHNTDVDDDGCE